MGLRKTLYCLLWLGTGAEGTSPQHTETGSGRCVWVPGMLVLKLRSEESTYTKRQAGRMKRQEAEEESHSRGHCAGLDALCGCVVLWYNGFCEGAMKKLFILQNN